MYRFILLSFERIASLDPADITITVEFIYNTLHVVMKEAEHDGVTISKYLTAW